MRAPTRTDSHLGRNVVAPLFALMLAVSGLWASSAGASRGSKTSCSSGGRARDGLGYRPHSTTVPVAAKDCPDSESGASSRSAPESGDTENSYERPSAGSPASSRPSGSSPGPRPGATRTYSNPSGRSPQASGNGGSKAGDGSSAGSSGEGANGSGASQAPPEAVSGQPRGGSNNRSGASAGGGKSPRRPSAGAGRGSGGGRGSAGSGGGRGSAGAGGGGNTSRPGGGYNSGPGGSDLPGFRVAPATPPSNRTRAGAGASGPGMAWSAFRAPGAALPNQTVAPAVVLPSTAAAVLGASTAPTAALIPSGPIPRTGGEISASAVLSVILILAGATLRRTARLTRR